MTSTAYRKKLNVCLRTAPQILFLGSLLACPASGGARAVLRGEAAIGQLQRQGAYDSLQAAVTAAHYRVRPAERRGAEGRPGSPWYASNPAHHLVACFNPGGIELARQSQGGTSRFGMKLAGYGYGEQILGLEAEGLEASDNRVQWSQTVAGQAGVAVTEWYVNRPSGLEQGFILHRPPRDRGKGERLRLQLETSGDLWPELATDGKRIWLKNRHDAIVLSYGELSAWDATGRTLGVEMGVAGDAVWLQVEDASAVYPVTVDPTFVEKQKLTASDGSTNDSFGLWVAIEGDTVVVGAPGDNSFRGAAYVFKHQGGSWVEQQKLTASDGVANDLFGNVVAISEGTVVVGAIRGGNVAQGAAYVFVDHGACQ